MAQAIKPKSKFVRLLEKSLTYRVFKFLQYYWDEILVVAGVANVIALIAQPIEILQTGDAKGVSVTTFALFAIIQLLFAIEFFRKESVVGWVTMIVSCAISIFTLLVIWLYS